MFYDYVLLIEIVAMLIGGLGSSDTILNILRIIQANVCSNWPSDIREDLLKVVDNDHDGCQVMAEVSVQCLH